MEATEFIGVERDLTPAKKSCPFCVRSIDAATVKCQYCGQWLPAATARDWRAPSEIYLG